MIHLLRTFWVVKTSAELVNLFAVVNFIEREILHIHGEMFLAAMQAKML